MLTIYRRHKMPDPQTGKGGCSHADDRYFRKCKCACWAEGTLEGEYQRRSLKTRSWERATEIVHELEAGKKAALPEAKKIPTIEEAIAKYTADAEHGRKLTEGTMRKYHVLFGQLKEFSRKRRRTQLKDIDVDFAREFRASWKDGPISSVKKLERFRAFCRFCHTAGWMERNPAISVARPVAKTPPTLPLADKDITKALTHADDARWHAFIQILRWSGLRIGDAMKLTPEKLDGNRLFLRTAKTGVPVYVPLPDSVVGELKTLPLY